jgi:crotonobetainyl-CoA:carnitine CoA-transferase CaiB-like acyl-CoA transferase
MSPGVRRAAPLRGEHTDAVLTDLGYSPAEIRTLRDKNATT